MQIVDARTADLDDIREAVAFDPGANEFATTAGMDVAIVLPESQKAFDMAMKLVRNHGTAVVVSFPQEKLAVSASDLVFRDINVVGSLVGRNYQIREMLAFVMKHNVSAEITTFPFAQLNQLVEVSRQGAGGKLVVDMTL